MDADFLLIKKIKCGDMSAGDKLIRKYYADILNYCSYHCQNRENIEDITQETFVHFFEKIAEYHHQQKVKNYLYTIARNLCIDYSRKSKDVLTEDNIILNTFGAEDTEINKEDQITLENAFKKLSDDLREVIILYYFQYFKVREIAQILNISVPLTKYRLHQAKKKLQNLIKEDI